MLEKQTFTHPQVGKVEIIPNSRARRIIMRARPDAIYITVPPAATDKDIERALATHGDKLLKQQSMQAQGIIEAGYNIDAPLYSLTVALHNKDCFALKEENGHITLLCPADTTFNNEKQQEWLRKVITESMRKRARQVLPARLAHLAATHGLHYNNVSIRDTHTRWGSCNSRGNISLCIYLVMLPCELIDYVLLHELCHTVEMNHSERFWKKLSSLTGKPAKQIREELRKHKPCL